MQYRELGRTGWRVSDISFGAWAIGADWGGVDDSESLAALHRAVDLGCNFIDTADVYGDGHSERLVAQLKRERPGEQIIVATKCGRRLPQQIPEGYTPDNINGWIDRSLKNLETDCLDIVQLHCPPTALYYMPEIFDALDSLARAGKIRYYGVSVEKVEEALKAIEYPNVQTVQIIFNMFRHRPSELFFQEAKRRRVGVLARVPLASGLLTGKMSRESQFSTNDHRQYNRFGASFDRGETFSGVDYDSGLRAVEELRALLPAGMSMTQFALRWILMFEAVTCAIPGAKRPGQVEENASASDLPPLTEAQMLKAREIYDKYIARQVHHRW
jgi:aryl-alcohol dehydrogenase-like predicted oxidoreductase